MFILDNFYCDRQIMITNQYCGYYYVFFFKLCLPKYFLSDYCNVMLVMIKKNKNLSKNETKFGVQQLSPIETY